MLNVELKVKCGRQNTFHTDWTVIGVDDSGHSGLFEKVSAKRLKKALYQFL